MILLQQPVPVFVKDHMPFFAITGRMTMTRRISVVSGLLLILLCTGVAVGQDDSTRSYERHHWDWFKFHRNPTISLVYGWMQSSLDGSTQQFYSPRSAELRLGGLRQFDVDESVNIVEHRNDNLFLGVASKDLGGAVNPGEIGFTAWRFGGAWEKGYGYKLTGASEGPAINLLTSDGVQWTNLALKGGITNSADSAILGMYEGGVRFGTKSGAVVRFHILPLLAVDMSYERSAVYRRHKVWEWLGGVIVQGGGDWLLDRFVDRILRSTPEAAPAVNFVLKNALSYGVYELRKKNGNWPFASEAPISNDTFMIGLTMVF
jgi:hypothetical protein